MKTVSSIKSKKGMTLLELTVVILVLLSLISILFIGARAWKKGSDRAGSILQIRNVQQAVRSFANMYPTDTLAEDKIFGTGKYIEVNPTTKAHPAGGTYAFAIAAPTVIPAIGSLYMKTTGGDAPDDYNPKTDDIKDW